MKLEKRRIDIQEKALREVFAGSEQNRISLVEAVKVLNTTEDLETIRLDPSSITSFLRRAYFLIGELYSKQDFDPEDLALVDPELGEILGVGKQR